MDIKRTVLWIVLIVSTALLFDSWQNFNAKSNASIPVLSETGSIAEKKDIVERLNREQELPISASNNLEVASLVTHSTPSIEEEKVRIITDLCRIDISSLGGNVTHLSLIKRGLSNQLNSSVTLFDQRAEHTYLARSGLIGGVFPNHLTRFFVVPGPRELANDKDELTVSLVSPIINGVRVTKNYKFKRGSFVIGLEQKIENVGDRTVLPVAYTELVRDSLPVETPRFSRTFMGPALYTNAERFQKISLVDIDKNKASFVRHTDNGWIAFVQHYFSTAWLIKGDVYRDIYVGKVKNLYRIGYKVPLDALFPGQSKIFFAELFAGPSEERMLEQIAPGLELVKDYGWVTIIAKPLFWLLEKLYTYIGNWGWAIIALTFFIKALFFPLSAASYRSMARMREVTPYLQELRERYKDEPQKLSSAMMEVYRKEKINPLGGCLPVLIQIPVFISLYWVLLSSVEMRGAGWILWLRDLSRQDPWFILPVLMALSMLIQTKLNPTPPDPIQAKMMFFLPLFFSGMFFFLPSGLVLYYVLNNVLSIAQQWYIMRLIHRKKGY